MVSNAQEKLPGIHGHQLPNSGFGNGSAVKGRKNSWRKTNEQKSVVNFDAGWGISLRSLFDGGVRRSQEIGDWTCYDFLKASKSQKSTIVYFVQGMSLAEKKDELDLAAKDFGVPVSKVVQHCQKNSSLPLWDAIVEHFNLP
jgi:hypothetical protein